MVNKNSNSSESWSLPEIHIVIGRIGQSFGVQGWVRLSSFCEPIDNILDYSPWFLRHKGQFLGTDKSLIEALGWRFEDGFNWAQIDVESIKDHGKGFVAALTGVTDRDQAQALKGCDIVVGRDQLPPLPEGEYYWWQLEGLQVLNLEEQVLGLVDQMMPTGANDVLVVISSKESVDQRRRLIPYLPDSVVKSVDLEARKIVVDWDVTF